MLQMTQFHSVLWLLFFCIHSSVDEHIGHFHILIVENNVALLEVLEFQVVCLGLYSILRLLLYMV